MNCETARELIGADPDNRSPELLEHLRSCPECQVFREQMLALNAQIRRALDLKLQPRSRGTGQASGGGPVGATGPVPGDAGGAGPSAAPPSNVTPLRRKPAPGGGLLRSRWMALAASVAGALFVGVTLWLGRPSESLAHDVVVHVEGEPDSWSRTQPVASEDVAAVLRKSGVKLGAGMDPVVYASSCMFRGHYVPHFVVMTKAGPVTVMILANERIGSTKQFHSDGYSGLLVPVKAGSVAVLSRSPMQLDQPARDVVQALQSGS
ncbi:MAG TPA: DUF3379 family protein [Steroidobacteraceae bacterium]|nr:DUF3379 family protein [Steroidobacteraceae bacterium]